MISISQRCQEIKYRYLGQCQAHEYCARGCQPQCETSTSHDHFVLSGIWFYNIEKWRLVYHSLHIFHVSPCGMYKYKNHWLLKSAGWILSMQSHPPNTSGDEGEPARLQSHKQVIPPRVCLQSFLCNSVFCNERCCISKKKILLVLIKIFQPCCFLHHM